MISSAQRMLRNELVEVAGCGEKAKPSCGQHWHPHSKCRRYVQPPWSGTAVEQRSKAGLQRTVQELWREFFSDPSQWWDHRAGKPNARYPDFKHKRTHEALWLNGNLKPFWVEAELAAMTPGTVPMNLFSCNRMLARHAKAGHYDKTMALFLKMQQEGLNPDEFTFVPVLNACAGLKSLEEGRHIHGQIVQNGYETDTYVTNSLIDMYAKCGSIKEAWAVFTRMPVRNVVSWNAMILGHVKCGQAEEALELFKQIQKEGIEPNKVTFIGVLSACTGTSTLEKGRSVHEQITHRGYESDSFVGTSLIDMYSKCGSIEDATRVFNNMPRHNVVAFTAMILGYVRCGQGQKALELCQQMQLERIDPDPLTFVGLLNACASVAALAEGRCVHQQVIQRGYESDASVGNSLINMYMKCGSTEDACRVFNKMTRHDVVSWTAMILGYARCSEGQKSLDLFERMQGEGVEPTSATFVAVLSACAKIAALDDGRRAHELIILRGHEFNLLVSSCLVDMYVKCGSIEDAQKVFNKMPKRDVIMWTAMILGYVKCGQGRKALELSQQMQQEGVRPNSLTFVGMLNACAGLGALKEGSDLHDQIIQRGWESDIFVGNSLIDMYAKCGSIADAWRTFNKMPERDVVSWTSIILGYVKCRQDQKALELFQQMISEGVEPDNVTFVGALNACANIGFLDKGRTLHSQIILRGYEHDVVVGSCLIDMYAKCGSLKEAQSVFNSMPTRNVVTWTAMIAGYEKCEEGRKALELFNWMLKEGVDPNPVTFMKVLNACASIGALEEGRFIHKLILERGCESDLFVGNSLIDMYAKCGSIEDAWRVFNEMPIHNVVTWAAIIQGYVKSGQGQKALAISVEMKKEGVEPDQVTFVGMLSACASVAALEEGRQVHEQIIQGGYECDVVVGSCLVDMYAKCGSIEDAWRVFNKMPRLDAVAWNVILGAFASHGHGIECLECFWRMCQEGVEMDGVTFISLLSACSHSGLVDEGLHFFESMSSVYNISAAGEHYNCLIDLLGRAGQMHEAEDIMRTMSLESDVSVWMSLLSCCRLHGNVDMGEGIAKQVIELDPGNFSVDVLLSNIYAATGKWQSLTDRGGEVVLRNN